MMPSRYGRQMPPARCQRCGRAISRDIGCRFCSDVMGAFSEQSRENPELPRPLLCLAAELFAGLNQTFISRHVRWTPSKDDLDTAADLAVERFKAIQYVLPKKSEGR